MSLPLTTQGPVPIKPRVQREGRRLPRVRGDRLPEETRYKDDGCTVHPHCLTCPLDRCRFDDPRGLRAILNEPRDTAIYELRQKGVQAPELSRRFGLSRRTIFRILENMAAQRKEREQAPIPIYLRRRKTEKEAQCA
jgi:hypothetical protein